MPDISYPFTDEYLNYDYNTHRYVLTEKDVLENLAIDLQADFRPDIKNSIDAFLKQVSSLVYGYIHEFSVNNLMQDFVIAKTPSGRALIKEAMEQQLIYILTVGDFSRSPKREERAIWFDDNARRILEQTIPEIGTTILYTGQINFCTHDQSGW